MFVELKLNYYMEDVYAAQMPGMWSHNYDPEGHIAFYVKNRKQGSTERKVLPVPARKSCASAHYHRVLNVDREEKGTSRRIILKNVHKIEAKSRRNCRWNMYESHM